MYIIKKIQKLILKLIFEDKKKNTINYTNYKLFKIFLTNFKMITRFVKQS